MPPARRPRLADGSLGLGHSRAHDAGAGFTLVELMVVILIISLMAMVAVVAYMDRINIARREIARMQIKEMDTAVKLFFIDQGRLPQAIEDLRVRPAQTLGWPSGGYIEDLPADPWGHDYVYRQPGPDGRAYDILSLAADGAEGGDGKNEDIRLQKERGHREKAGG